MVIAGNDKGKVGVLLFKKNDRVIVKGVNVRKKHIKKKQSSQTVYVEMPIHISNVAICNKDGKKIKLKRKGDDLIYLEDGKEVIHRNIRKRDKK